MMGEKMATTKSGMIRYEADKLKGKLVVIA
jgi:hypothetical protein